MGEVIRILHVDDNETLLRFRARLLNEFDTLDVVTANDVDAGLRRLDTEAFDCVLSDLDMPERDGIDFLNTVRERYPDLPFILLTASQPGKLVTDALAADVTDYVVKTAGEGFHDVLVNRIERFVAYYRVRKRLREIENGRIPSD